MNLRLRQVATHVLPLAILSFCLITLRVSHHCPGEVEEFNYGFPLGWLTPSLVSSMEYIVDLPALAIDFLVYLGVWFLLSWTSLFRKIFGWQPRLVSGCLWIVAAVIGGLFFSMLLQTGHRGSVGLAPRSDCAGEIVSYRLQLWSQGSRLP